MPTPTLDTLVADAQGVLNLQNITTIRSAMAVALANANTGTPLNPNLTNQQLINEAFQVMTLPKSDIESIIVNQMMKFMFAPPAPGGVGANQQVIFNDGGVEAGDAGLLFDKATDKLTVAFNVDIWRGLLNDGTSTAVGTTALAATTTGATGNTAIGSQALYRATTGNNNTAVGRNALSGATMTGNSNVAIGVNALQNNSSGSNCVAVGASAAPVATGSNLTAVGAGALLLNTSGANNTAIGFDSLRAVVSSNNCTALGYQAARANTAADVTAIGSNALALGTVGGGNTAVGKDAMGTSVVTGSFNTSIGSDSGAALLGGSSNTLLGVAAGNTITTGSSNICIGRAAITSSATVSNELVLGSATQFVATNGAAATYFPTATAGAVVPGNCQGFIRIYLNGTFVKIPVYGN
jgi:hypothetical protein